jgi:hypothetical protein
MDSYLVKGWPMPPSVYQLAAQFTAAACAVKPENIERTLKG